MAAGDDKQSPRDLPFSFSLSLSLIQDLDIVIMRSGNKTSPDPRATPKTGEIPTEKNTVTAFTPRALEARKKH